MPAENGLVIRNDGWSADRRAEGRALAVFFFAMIGLAKKEAVGAGR
jgi:hypothetical protein